MKAQSIQVPPAPPKPMPKTSIPGTAPKSNPTNMVVPNDELSDDKTLFVFSVTATTTHVISGEGKRTLNLLKGLMQVLLFPAQDEV